MDTKPTADQLEALEPIIDAHNAHFALTDERYHAGKALLLELDALKGISGPLRIENPSKDNVRSVSLTGEDRRAGVIACDKGIKVIAVRGSEGAPEFHVPLRYNFTTSKLEAKDT